MKFSFGLIILLISFFAKAFPQSPQEVFIELGKSEKLNSKSKQAIVLTKNIIELQLIESQPHVKCISIGETLIQLESSEYLIQCHLRQSLKFHQNFEKENKNIIGLNEKFENGKPFIEGQLFSIKHYLQIISYSERYKSPYSLKLTMSSKLQKDIQSYINHQLIQVGLRSQPLLFSPRLIIKLNEKDEDFKQYEQIVKKYGIELQKDKRTVETSPLIKVQVTIAEVKKGNQIKWGVQWPQQIGTTILTNGNTTWDDLVFNATLFENEGFGKILASPNIVTRSGDEGEFWAGGELPIKILNYKIQDIVWKKYGIMLKVKPQADGSGRISLNLEAEVSSLDGSQMIDGIPSLNVDRVKSHFDLNHSQTIALSGLIKNEQLKNSSGLPYLSKLPIIGALFSSKDFLENNTELVIFVKPTIINDNLQDSPKHFSAGN